MNPGQLVFGTDGTAYLYVGEGSASKLDFTTGEVLTNPTALVVKLGSVTEYTLDDANQLHTVAQTPTPTAAA